VARAIEVDLCANRAPPTRIPLSPQAPLQISCLQASPLSMRGLIGCVRQAGLVRKPPSFIMRENARDYDREGEDLSRTSLSLQSLSLSGFLGMIA
jgi:hypothetical protein